MDQASPFISISNDNQGVKYDLPQGRPEPKVCCPVGVDNRARVYSPGAAQSLCLYNSADKIRRYVGPRFCDELKDLQMTELSLGVMKQRQADHENKLETLNGLYTPISKKIDKKEALNSFMSQNYIIANREAQDKMMKVYHANGAEFTREMVIKKAQELAQLFKDFLDQNRHTNLYDYITEVKFKPRLQIQIDFLKSIGVSDSERVELIKKYCLPSEKKLIEEGKIDEISLAEMIKVTQYLVQEIALKHFGLETTLWEPSHPFDFFVETLKKRGPLCVIGNLGITYYAKAPKKLPEQLGTRDVYGWEKGAERSSMNATINHAIVVVGAVKNAAGQEVVYFLDPRNESDPANPSLDKVYKISYKNLQTYTKPLATMPKTETHGDVTGFAWARKL